MSIKQAIEALELALPFMEEQATIQGYGFYRPANPHNFFPDPESCTEAEIENHRAACEAYDEGKFVPDTSGGWVSPWGIGSYTDTIPEIQAQCDKARAALAALRSMPQGEPVATIRYERGTPGKENDMPKVVSCNWLPDGVYSVYATPHTEAVRMSEAWQPIDSAPTDTLILLAGAKRSPMVCGMKHSRDGWVIDTPSEWASMYPPTHWQALPSAPTKGAE